MRALTLHRSGLEERHVRLDPPYYAGRRRVRSQIEDEASRVVPLADLIAAIHDGARLPAVAEGVPTIRLANVRSCELDLDHLSQGDGTASRWVEVQPDDVLFTRAAQPFRAAVVPRTAPTRLAASSELAIIKPQPAVLSEYLAVAFCTPTINQTLLDLAYRGRSSALPRLRLSDIKRLPIPLPSQSLQESVATQYRQSAALTAKAREEIRVVAAAIQNEIDRRTGDLPQPSRNLEVLRSRLGNRWDVPFHCGVAFRSDLATSGAMRPLLQLAKPRVSSLKGLSNDDDVLLVTADALNDSTFMVEEGEVRRLGELSDRMRQRVKAGDVLLCTTGGGDQTAYVDAELDSRGLTILASATFTALHFTETPRVFAVALAHPLVRQQLALLSSGSMQRFVNKRDLDELLIPVLGSVWREDFENRLERAMQRRREALAARAALIESTDAFLRRAMP